MLALGFCEGGKASQGLLSEMTLAGRRRGNVRSRAKMPAPRRAIPIILVFLVCMLGKM